MKENEYIPVAIKQVTSLCFAIPIIIVIIVCLWIKKIILGGGR
jgi:hypothetical protein